MFADTNASAYSRGQKSYKTRITSNNVNSFKEWDKG